MSKATKQPISLTLTHEEYANLIKLTYAGTWLINAIRNPGEEIKKFSHIEQAIFRVGLEQGFSDLLQHSKIDGRNQIFPTQKLETSEIEGYITEYNVQTMFDGLVDILAFRDLYREYSEKDAQAMTPAERRDKLDVFLDKYENEFEEHGMDRLGIIE